MSPSAGGGEVERVRDLLAQMQARQKARPAFGESRGPDMDAPDPRTDSPLVVLDFDGDDDAAKPRGPRPKTCEVRWRLADSPEGAVDGAMIVPLDVATKLRSSCAAVVSRDELEWRVSKLEGEFAFERLVEGCKARERCASECIDRLVLAGVPRTVALQATERAIRCGIVDDRRYAEVFIATKIRAGWGKSRIERELSLRRVDPYLLEGYPDAFFDVDDERDRAWALLERKPVPSKNPVEKLARFLVGKGFAPGLALSLAKRRVAECGEGESE